MLLKRTFIKKTQKNYLASGNILKLKNINSLEREAFTDIHLKKLFILSEAFIYAVLKFFLISKIQLI